MSVKDHLADKADPDKAMSETVSKISSTNRKNIIPVSNDDRKKDRSSQKDSSGTESSLKLKKHQRQVPSCAQNNALDNWNRHMELRRTEQDSLSALVHRPAEHLQMNDANRFRVITEKKEMLNQAFPLVNSAYSLSGFWRLPERYGDETSGIATTLTKTERGVREPITQVGLPSSIRQESGLKEEHTVNDAYLTWDQSIYLKQQCQMLGEAIQDLDFNRPDITKLEVIGSSIYPPFSSETCSNASLENTNKKEEPMDQHEDTKDTKEILKSNDVEPESKDLSVPALRISGLANRSGNANQTLIFQHCTDQSQVGVNTTILFDCPPGKLQTSCIELHNIGSTAIFYSWERLPLPHNFPHLLPSTKTQNSFYFHSSSRVILPGEIHKIKCSFKSDKPGIQTELWQVNTHPVLLQGAPIQVTLRGVVMYQDRTADPRLYIEKKLEKKITVQVCRLIVHDVVKGIHTPERPSSPAELWKTEEEEFLLKNPKICYKNQPVEELKKLWHKVKPESAWDLSVSALRQALLSLPDDEAETRLAQFNLLLVQLTEPSHELQSPTVAVLGQLMWREQVDTMEKDTWMDKNGNKKEEEKSGASDTIMTNLYPRLLHQKVYGLMENLVESSCEAEADETQKIGTRAAN